MKRYEGNYSRFLDQKILDERNHAAKERDKTVKIAQKNIGKEVKFNSKKNNRRLSFKETRELEELDLKLPLLEKQKTYLEKKITDNDVDISEISHQLAEIMESIQDHEDRWMELSELLEAEK